jgi:hypothetical protein
VILLWFCCDFAVILLWFCCDFAVIAHPFTCTARSCDSNAYILSKEIDLPIIWPYLI